MKGKTIAISGGFDPLHTGHLKMFYAAKELVGEDGVVLIILNDDEYLIQKKGKAFMSQDDRAEILKALRPIDEVFKHTSTKDMSVIDALESLKPDLFGNGGDVGDGTGAVKTMQDIAEFETCQKLGIEMIVGLGGNNQMSSSELLKKYNA